VLLVSAAFQLVGSWWAILILPVTFVEGVLIGSISLFYTSVVPSIYAFNFFFTLIINPLFLLSGVFFPLDTFPEVLQDISWFTPLRPAVEIVRGLFKGEMPENIGLCLASIAIYILVFFSLTLVTMRRRLTK
jgi:lipooligosaccharide transport system permease protein